MMLRGPALATVMTMCVVLAGCVDHKFGPSVPESALEVVDWQWESSGCLRTTVDKWCHTVTARLSNLDNETDLDVRRMDWDAVADDGGVYSARSHDGPDAVAPQREAIFTIRFETPEDVRLETLRFESFFMHRPVTAPIPPTP